MAEKDYVTWQSLTTRGRRAKGGYGLPRERSFYSGRKGRGRGGHAASMQHAMLTSSRRRSRRTWRDFAPKPTFGRGRRESQRRRQYSKNVRSGRIQPETDIWFTSPFNRRHKQFTTEAKRDRYTEYRDVLKWDNAAQKWINTGEKESQWETKEVEMTNRKQRRRAKARGQKTTTTWYRAKKAYGDLSNIAIGELDPMGDYTDAEREDYRLKGTEWFYRRKYGGDLQRARTRRYGGGKYSAQDYAEWRGTLSREDLKKVSGRRYGTRRLQSDLKCWESRVGNRREFDAERRETEATLEKIREERKVALAEIRAEGLQRELAAKEERSRKTKSKISGGGVTAAEPAFRAASTESVSQISSILEELKEELAAKIEEHESIQETQNLTSLEELKEFEKEKIQEAVEAQAAPAEAVSPAPAATEAAAPAEAAPAEVFNVEEAQKNIDILESIKTLEEGALSLQDEMELRGRTKNLKSKLKIALEKSRKLRAEMEISGIAIPEDVKPTEFAPKKKSRRRRARKKKIIEIAGRTKPIERRPV